MGPRSCCCSSDTTINSDAFGTPLAVDTHCRRPRCPARRRRYKPSHPHNNGTPHPGRTQRISLVATRHLINGNLPLLSTPARLHLSVQAERREPPTVTATKRHGCASPLPRGESSERPAPACSLIPFKIQCLHNLYDCAATYHLQLSTAVIRTHRHAGCRSRCLQVPF
jgi:hypothetical protein